MYIYILNENIRRKLCFYIYYFYLCKKEQNYVERNERSGYIGKNRETY